MLGINCETLPKGGYWGTMVANNYDRIKAVIPSLPKFPMSEDDAREFYLQWCRQTDMPIDPDVTSLLRSFFKLYEGLKAANDNGTGYSPRVAEAMKELKETLDT